MSNLAIQVCGLGKQYHIGHSRQSYTTFRETLIDVFAGPVRRARSLIRGQATGAAELDETFWALKDVSFEVQHGETLGIIGHNGAGKSTLLKILSRITEPTEGYVDIYGRVGAMLEVGTGFHPELTGRENIYLNGAILGMTRADIHRQFDAIVDFAGVEKFIDTPIKHYSSGMALRLGFSVAAHLEPEILIVDEVLAVGDAEFQKKCLGKMGEVAGEGRTVLFVSHNMAAVMNLCEKSLHLRAGQIVHYGSTKDVVEAYVSQSDEVPGSNLESRMDRRGNGRFRFYRFAMRNTAGEFVPTLISGEDAEFLAFFRGERPLNMKSVQVSMKVVSVWGERLFTVYNGFSGDTFEGNLEAGVFVCHVPKLPLAPGRYTVSLWSALGHDEIDWITDCASFDVVAGDYYGTGKAPDIQTHGAMLLPHHWSLSVAEHERQ
ncbi:MAG: ABC transporter ATP-binding protein [Anaerolineae bacterium]|nr:ABC transporter ATP-binding protein [Anaerolineae bacterium]